MKKLVVVLVLATLVGAGSFGQIMLGVTGDLHMDTNLTSSQIVDKFKSGEGIFYGPFAEIAFGRLGFGVAGTFAFWTDTLFATDFMTYDITGYVSYHLFRARAFLDPFGELGGGFVADDYANSADDPNADNPVSASLFWYGALGVGVNLGPIGIFGKFAYNSLIKQQLDEVDASGNKTGNKIPYYGFADATGTITPYIPAMRVTIGAKLIL